MHGHALRQLAEKERLHLWTDIGVGALYGALKRMVADGLLTEVRLEREGHFPERQVYAITGSGLAALAEERTNGLAEVVFRPDPFDLALARLDPTRLDEVPRLLAERLATLEALLTDIEQHTVRARPYLTLLEAHTMSHREHRARAEIAWHRELLAALPAILADEAAQQPSPDLPA